jgi:hypothetical protein
LLKRSKNKAGGTAPGAITSSGLKTAAENQGVFFIVILDGTSIAVVQQQPGVQYGQRKQKSEKRNQEAEEREAKGCASDLPLTGRPLIACDSSLGNRGATNRVPSGMEEKTPKCSAAFFRPSGWFPIAAEPTVDTVGYCLSSLAGLQNGIRRMEALFGLAD